MKKGIIRLNKRIMITLLVMVVMFIFSCILSKMISNMEEEACWDELHRSVNELSAEIVSKVGSDQTLLDSIADIIAGQDSLDSPEVRKIIDGFRPNNTILNIALLLPGDKVMLPGEPIRDGRALLSFEKEAALGRHVSNRSVDIRDENRLILRNFVPVEKNGETIAMLYSIADLQTLPEHFSCDAYDGQAAVYIIDGPSGNFLLDTWHDTLGNLSDLGKREVKKGYSQEQMYQDVCEGKPGYCVFVSRTMGDDLYFFYEPVAVNNWSVGVSVTETVAFARARKVNHMLLGFIFLEIAVLGGYFIYILLSTGRELREKQRLAERDILTGLFNRNSFEKNTRRYAGDCKTSLTCVYIDVNGLHELNNSQGHAAGDEMLKTVAHTLHDFFDDRDIYRIGGDEFVVFVRDTKEAITGEKMERISAYLTERGYHLSVGIHHHNLPIDTEKLIKQAEKRMYEDKERYYSRTGIDRRVRT